jgi:hypothetical protein
MDKDALNKVCKQIYKRFPPVKNKQPKVSAQGGDRYLLVFSGSGKAPDGTTIQQNVRVVATEDGRIIKTSMSR